MMTSYLFSTSALLESVTTNDRAHLLHLIRLGIRAITLKVDLFLNFGPSEHVMTSTRPLHEAEREQQRTKIVETYIRIAPATQDLISTFACLLKPS